MNNPGAQLPGMLIPGQLAHGQWEGGEGQELSLADPSLHPGLILAPAQDGAGIPILSRGSGKFGNPAWLNPFIPLLAP